MDGPEWLNANYTEPRVLVAVRDLCRPGETVYDVGANFGGITVGMSRTVGPRGAVCAFEANPAIAKRCQDAIVRSGCGNVQLYHGAIYKESGGSIDLYLSDNQVADSIHYRVSDRSISVPTLALDDFVERTRLVPSFVKMDIEGAEYDALIGFEKTIAAHKPTIILEQAPSETRCLALLQKHGYEALDLSTYQSVESMSDLPPETVVTDILFAQPEYLRRQRYTPGLTLAAQLSASDFQSASDLIIDSKPLDLPSGRYIVKADFDSAGESRELLCGIRRIRDPEPLMQHHGHSDSLSKLAHRWVFDTPASSITVQFRFIGAVPANFRIQDVLIWSVDSLAGRAQLWM